MRCMNVRRERKEEKEKKREKISHSRHTFCAKHRNGCEIKIIFVFSNIYVRQQGRLVCEEDNNIHFLQISFSSQLCVVSMRLRKVLLWTKRSLSLIENIITDVSKLLGYGQIINKHELCYRIADLHSLRGIPSSNHTEQKDWWKMNRVCGWYGTRSLYVKFPFGKVTDEPRIQSRNISEKYV